MSEVRQKRKKEKSVVAARRTLHRIEKRSKRTSMKEEVKLERKGQKSCEKPDIM